MFELLVARKYLVPKRKQLSVSLIALMSVAVISLVVWLVLIFLSVTSGIEKSWLHKLTSLNAPIKISPTQTYYNSYYYLIDGISSASDYASKSLKEKLMATASDPYLPEIDEAIPSYWPAPDVDHKGHLKDPVKMAFACFEKLKTRYPTLVAQDYEITGALMKLRLIRPTTSFLDAPHYHEQSFLTQMTYVASFSNESPFLYSLLLPPSAEDLNHLLYLSSLSTEDTSHDLPQSVGSTQAPLFQKRLQSLSQHLEKQLELRPAEGDVRLTQDFFPDNTSIHAVAHLENEIITHITIPTNLSKKFFKEARLPSKHLLYGVLEKKENHLYFSAPNKPLLDVTLIPLYTDEHIRFEGQLNLTSLESANHLDEVLLQVHTKIQHLPISGQLSWKTLQITQATPLQYFQTPPTSIPLWPYFVNHLCALPKSTVSLENQDHSALLPKHFKDHGVRIGDKGFLSYGVATANAMQEQRLPIYVAGFYDPGIMAVGAKCILMDGDIVHNIATSSNSFTLDQTMASGIQVWFQEIDQTSLVTQELLHLFQEQGIDRYFTITPFYEYDFAKDLMQQFQSDRYLFTLVGVIILIVACSNIISFLVLMVNDKKKEIGILQSMGASSKSIALIFAGCGASLGLIGSVVGTLGAYLTMHHIDGVVRFLSFLQGHEAFHENFYGQSLPHFLSGEATLFMLISTPILSLLAGLIPAMKACKLRPAITLRSE